MEPNGRNGIYELPVRFGWASYLIRFCEGDANYKRVYYKCLLLFIVRIADALCRASGFFSGGEVNTTPYTVALFIVQHHLLTWCALIRTRIMLNIIIASLVSYHPKKNSHQQYCMMDWNAPIYLYLFCHYAIWISVYKIEKESSASYMLTVSATNL